MTAPIASDYPDFGRYQAQAAKVYAKALSINNATDLAVNLGYVGDVPHLRANVTATVNTFLMSVDFFADAAGTTYLNSHTISFRAVDIFARTLPVLGPFCRVTFFYAGANFDVDYSFSQATIPSAGLELSSSANVLFSIQQNCAVGATLFEGNRVYPGPAVLFAELVTAATFVDLRSVSSTGTITTIGRVRNPNSPYPLPLFLPAQHLQILCQNNSAGAAFFTVFVTADPGLGGY
jgi:hypothetical protein